MRTKNTLRHAALGTLLALAGVLSGTTPADAGQSVVIPTNTRFEVVDEKAVVIASNHAKGSAIGLSVTILTDGDDPLQSGIVLADGQTFTLAVPGANEDHAIRYVFRRAGPVVELMLPDGRAVVRMERAPMTDISQPNQWLEAPDDSNAAPSRPESGAGDRGIGHLPFTLLKFVPGGNLDREVAEK